MERSCTFFISLCCLLLTACGISDAEIPPVEDAGFPAPQEEISPENFLEIKNIRSEETAILSQEDGTSILQMLDNRGWAGEPTDCASDITITAPDVTYTYHSDCGTVLRDGATMTFDETSRKDFNAILGRYIALQIPTEPSAAVFDWGVTLTAENVTATGLTLRCAQSGGSPSGELNTGSYFVLEQKTDEGWEILPQYETAWTEEAWMIPLNGETSWDVSWRWVYGTLSEGSYRIGKEIMDWRAPGDFDRQMVYAEFEVPQLMICDGLPLAPTER